MENFLELCSIIMRYLSIIYESSRQVLVFKDELLIAFMSSVISVYITIQMQKFYTNKERQKDLFFEIYMKLIELNDYYFWLASAQKRKEEEPKNIKEKEFLLRWTIADMSRKLEIDELEDILKILFLEKFSYNNRYEELSKLIDKIGHKVNPKYKKITQIIDGENFNYFAKNIKSTEENGLKF